MGANDDDDVFVVVVAAVAGDGKMHLATDNVC